MCVLEILGEAASQLFKSSAKHKDHELCKWIAWPDNTRKYLPNRTQGDACVGNRLNNNPRNCKHRAHRDDDEDGPPGCFCRPCSYGNDRDNETK